ncbi:MAG: SDR family oxidoreductase, partial [Actinomycetes bacterium]
MAYFVTGATGFIGQHLVERLLENRKDEIYVLVREGSADKLETLMTKWSEFGDTDRVKPVFGDLSQPLLGVDSDERQKLSGKIDHFFHLAAVYDMTADEEQNVRLNVGGTENAVELANEIGAGIFHHTSSIAAAGMFKGHFTEDMFDEGQKLTHPYHRTKFESERYVRKQVKGAWQVYRPAIVVGHSKTGEMDKID